MSNPFSYLIRDGVAEDIPECAALDHSYASDHVWQMRIQQDSDQRQVTFSTERLPRSLEIEYPCSEERMRLSVPDEHCFLVAAGKAEGEILGYLTMRHEPAHNLARIHDLVISRPYRRRKMGSRLLKIALNWAEERKIRQILMEIQTQNYPASQFCLGSGFTFCGYNDLYFSNQDIALFFGTTLR